MPGGIVANGIDDDSAPHAIAAGDLSRKTGKRHERVYEVRVTLTPQPCVHAAHRCAHHEPEVCHTEALGQQSILRLDHVEVSVARKGGAKAVARLAGSSMTDPVGKHDEISRRIQQAARPKKFSGKLLPDELSSGPAGAVQYQHGVAHDSLRVLLRLAERAVMQSKLRQCFAGCESEIGDDKIRF